MESTVLGVHDSIYYKKVTWRHMYTRKLFSFNEWIYNTTISIFVASFMAYHLLKKKKKTFKNTF